MGVGGAPYDAEPVGSRRHGSHRAIGHQKLLAEGGFDWRDVGRRPDETHVVPARPLDGPGSIPMLVDLSGVSRCDVSQSGGAARGTHDYPACYVMYGRRMWGTRARVRYTDDLVSKFPLAYKRGAHRPHGGSSLEKLSPPSLFLSLVFRLTSPLPVTY